MAWIDYPFVRGQPITYESLNELRDACIERRSISAPALAKRGTPIGTYLASMRTAINASVDASKWYWLQSYASVSSWSLKRLVRTETAGNDQNIFELALGSGITSWQHVGEMSFEAINEIYSVLRRMTLIEYGAQSVSSANSGIYKYPLGAGSTSALALASLGNWQTLNAAKWSQISVNINGAAYVAQQDTGYSLVSGGQYVSGAFSSVYFLPLLIGYRVFVASDGSVSSVGLVRSVSFDVRAWCTSAPPEGTLAPNYYDVQSAGASLGTGAIPAGTVFDGALNPCFSGHLFCMASPPEGYLWMSVIMPNTLSPTAAGIETSGRSAVECAGLVQGGNLGGKIYANLVLSKPGA